MRTGPDRDPSLVARAFEKHEQAFREATLPLYGLGPEWSGSRSIGGYEFWESEGSAGQSSGREYGLVHGDGHPDLRPDLPYLRIVTSTTDVLGGPLRSVLESEAEPPAGPEEIERAGAGEEWDSPLPGAVHHPVDILVDGEPVVFDALTRGPAWVARHGFGDYVITVEARHFGQAQLSLVPITDLEPYLRGWRERRATLRPRS